MYEAEETKPRRRRSRGLEKRFQGRVVVALQKLGFFVSSTAQPQRAMMTAGIPDLYAAHHGWKLTVWIEVKVKPNKLTTSQLVWHTHAKAAGVNVITVYSLEDLVRELKALGAPIV